MALLSAVRSTQLAYGSEFYEISDEYDSSVSGFSGDYEYVGYLNPLGKWIIQEHTISSGAYRYVNGSSGYSAAWVAAIAGSLTYDYYYTLSNLTP